MYCVLLDASLNTTFKLFYTNLISGTHGIIYTNWVQEIFWVKYKIINSDTSEIMHIALKYIPIIVTLMSQPSLCVTMWNEP